METYCVHAPLSATLGVRVSVGVELELIRWQMATHNLSSVLDSVSPDWELDHEVSYCTTETCRPLTVQRNLIYTAIIIPLSQDERENSNTKLNGGVNFLVGDIEDAASTDPFTHVYMYVSSPELSPISILFHHQRGVILVPHF